MPEKKPYNIFPLGDAALIIDFGNVIDESINKLVHAVFHELLKDPIPGVIETVPAYCSLTIYYDVLFVRKKTGAKETAFEWIAEKSKRIFIKGKN